MNVRVAALFLLVLAYPLVGQEALPAASVSRGNGGASPQAHECFQWFSTLGYPEVKDAPWVKVWTGYEEEWSDSAEPDTRLAFLLSERDGKFEVLELDLARRTWTSRPTIKKAEWQVRYEKQDFHAYTQKLLDELRHPPEKRDPWARFGVKLGQKSEVFFIAYVAWQRGDAATAQALFDEAAKLPLLEERAPMKTEPGAMRLDLEKELGYTAMWRAVLRCHYYAMPPRSELRDAFQDIVDQYPCSRHAERAKALVKTFDRMIQEDATHVHLTDEQLAALPVEEQVREYIFRLRDQHGSQWGFPGSCDLFRPHSPAGPDTTAHRLVELGKAAVPQLIDALSDDSLARAVGCHRDFYFSHHVLTVGDCAEIILSRIAKQDFFKPRSTFSYMSMDGQVEATRKKAEAWWKSASRVPKKKVARS